MSELISLLDRTCGKFRLQFTSNMLPAFLTSSNDLLSPSRLLEVEPQLVPQHTGQSKAFHRCSSPGSLYDHRDLYLGSPASPCVPWNCSQLESVRIFLRELREAVYRLSHRATSLSLTQRWRTWISWFSTTMSCSQSSSLVDSAGVTLLMCSTW